MLVHVTLSPTERSTVRRGAHRARPDRDALHRLLDDALICHLGVVVDGAPRVLPTCFGRHGDTLYLHGSTGARSLREAPRTQVCATVTHLDGIVYARSLMHHSVNYRSAVVHGEARQVTDEDERLLALRVISEQLAPGSWQHARQPDRRELAKTAVLALDLTEAAVKVRATGPNDDPEDVAAGTAWAGVLPLRTAWGDPEPSPDLSPPLPVPPHVRDRPRKRPE
ncbi:pyridoxamine 5'-phosphate oxidase family protein [Saccharopolyspora sp. CA-218241]|uniref:pyridoxamine 5'-phosphate oxidase family protein n=1 Tax=Saccharopolyspora sp. CA-218241 TaxID=3240027 RepID=UPI003D96DE10